MLHNPHHESYNLTPLGEKIFYDRYALKDGTRKSLETGDLVVVCVDKESGRRELATVGLIFQDSVLVNMSDTGERVTVPIEAVDKPLELCITDMYSRVAKGIASVEENPKVWEAEFYSILADQDFVPAGRILAAAGTEQDLSFFNCFVLPSPTDSRQGIFSTLQDMAELMSRGGGVGINLSTLRPWHSYVKGVNGRSSGSVSWGSLFSFVTGLIEQGGSRRGALMLILNDWHPDIFDFISAKRTAGKITNANISVGVSDKFMEAVRKGDDWALVFPDTSVPGYTEKWTGVLSDWTSLGLPVITHKVVKAKELWDAIVDSAHASAEPGLWFVDRTNNMSNSGFYSEGSLVATNPCGEEPLPGWGVCNLGHVNLANMVIEGEKPQVNWTRLRRAVELAVRFLDNAIDVTPYHFQEIANRQQLERRIGLGTIGLAEFLIKMKTRYGSEEAIQLVDRVYDSIKEKAYVISASIAEEKGSFGLFSEKILDRPFVAALPRVIRNRIKTQGLRNVTLLTQAPTGTVGTMVNTSTGIEPFYAWEWKRSGKLGDNLERVRIYKEWKDSNPDKELPNYFVTSMELTPEEHVRMQAAIQKHVDAAISKTVNCPADWTVDQVGELYRLMYDLGCKGGTIYRDKSRDTQVLSLIEKVNDKYAEAFQKLADTPVAPTVRPRPYKRFGATISKETPSGTAHITMNDDEGGTPFEVFVELGKAGSDLKGMAEALGRMVSLVLRVNSPLTPMERIQEIVNQLKEIGGPRSVGFGTRRVRSLPDAIAQALEEHYVSSNAGSRVDGGAVLPVGLNPHRPPEDLLRSGQSHVDSGGSAEVDVGVRGDLCPQCGFTTFVNIEGCTKCFTCGHSEC